MPKFYGQNKKRIDPRYFLNETVNRGDVDDDGDVDPHDVAALATKVAQSSDTSREQLMVMISDRIREVGGTTEKPDENRPEAIPTEEDFDYAKEELCDENSNLCGEIMPIGYEEFLYFEENKNKENLNYNLASSVMQHDDSIPLQKKIPSGYGTRGGKKSGQLEFPGLD